MSLKIVIPERTHQEFGHSLSKLLPIVGSIASTTEAEIELDFSRAKMLNPFFLGGIASIIDYARVKGKSIKLNHKENYRISSYLERIYFPSCYSPEKENEQAFFEGLETYQGKTYIPIIAFPTGADNYHSSVREKMLSAVSALLKNQLNFKERERQPLAYFLDELTHNVNDHSGADKGFLFAQFYPGSNYLDLVICDNGKGVYASYKGNTRFKPADEIEALRFAVNGRSTKDRPESKGFGISTSRKMLVHGLRGKFFILTGRTAFIETIEREDFVQFPEDFTFQGTFIALRIPTIMSDTFNFYDFIE